MGIERTRERLYSLEAVCGPDVSSHGYGLRNDGARGLLRDQSRDASGKRITSRGAAVGDEPAAAVREGKALKGPWTVYRPARVGGRTGNSMRVRNRFFDRMVYTQAESPYEAGLRCTGKRKFSGGGNSGSGGKGRQHRTDACGRKAVFFGTQPESRKQSPGKQVGTDRPVTVPPFGVGQAPTRQHQANPCRTQAADSP
jgi:hypothetical protein